MELGSFYPFSRNHNGLGYKEQDPAAWGPGFADRTKKVLETRYTLLPYLYTMFYHAHVSGTDVFMLDVPGRYTKPSLFSPLSRMHFKNSNFSQYYFFSKYLYFTCKRSQIISDIFKFRGRSTSTTSLTRMNMNSKH